jgi:hypothetical protein
MFQRLSSIETDRIYSSSLLQQWHISFGEFLTSYYWLGTSKDAAAFGKAWDAWRDALGDSESTPAKLAARFQECNVNLGRRSYDVY